MFVRTKVISGKTYAYLVESYWTKQGTRQKVKAYLGRVRSIPKTEPIESDSLENLIRTFLTQIGFIKTNNFGGEVYELKLDKTIFCNFDTKTIFVGNNKPACLEVNEGFFCTQTLQDVFELPKTITDVEVHERPAKVANAIVSLGIVVHPQSFVELYQSEFSSK